MKLLGDGEGGEVWLIIFLYLGYENEIQNKIFNKNVLVLNFWKDFFFYFLYIYELRYFEIFYRILV